MKIYSLSVVLAPPKGPVSIISSASDVSSFSFYQRASVREFLTFLTNTLVERTPEGQRVSVQEDDKYTAHVYNMGGERHLAAIVITDQEYPARPASSLLNKVLDDFVQKVPQESFANPGTISFPEIQKYFEQYQDPRQIDTIMQIQQELDETKGVLYQTIESVLHRGEKLDNLVERSNALSIQSKMFYKSAKQQNSCCIIM